MGLVRSVISDFFAIIAIAVFFLSLVPQIIWNFIMRWISKKLFYKYIEGDYRRQKEIANTTSGYIFGMFGLLALVLYVDYSFNCYLNDEIYSATLTAYAGIVLFGADVNDFLSKLSQSSIYSPHQVRFSVREGISRPFAGLIILIAFLFQIPTFLSKTKVTDLANDQWWFAQIYLSIDCSLWNSISPHWYILALFLVLITLTSPVNIYNSKRWLHDSLIAMISIIVFVIPLLGSAYIFSLYDQSPLVSWELLITIVGGAYIVAIVLFGKLRTYINSR